MLSGYRVFSRRFVKSFPVLSGGFEIETELTIHALELGLAVAEIDTPYYARPKGSASKLNTWSDGFRILRTIVRLYRAERPLPFFTGIGLALAIASVGFAIPIVVTYLETGLVPRLPTAVLVDRTDDPGVSVRRHRAGARHGDARAARDEAARLSGAPGAGRGTPAATAERRSIAACRSGKCSTRLALPYSPQSTSGPSVLKMCFTGSAWLTRICATMSAAPTG